MKFSYRFVLILKRISNLKIGIKTLQKLGIGYEDAIKKMRTELVYWQDKIRY